MIVIGGYWGEYLFKERCCGLVLALLHTSLRIVRFQFVYLVTKWLKKKYVSAREGDHHGKHYHQKVFIRC